MRRLLLAVVLASLAQGCATGGFIEMSVKAYSDPERSLTSIRTFAVVPVNLTMGNPLLEKELLYLVKQRLVARGLTVVEWSPGDGRNPDVLVSLAGYMGPFEQYVPPSTFYLPVPTSSTSTVRSNSPIIARPGEVAVAPSATVTTQSTSYVPISRGGYTVTQYYRNIQVFVAEPAAEKFNVLWSGAVESSGGTADLLVVAPTLLDQLLAEFPRRTGVPTFRRVHWAAPQQPH